MLSISQLLFNGFLGLGLLVVFIIGMIIIDKKTGNKGNKNE